MNKNLIKALLQGIPSGLLLALGLILFRTFLGGGSFMANLGSVYGILTLVCFPIAFVWMDYRNSMEEKK